MNFYNISFENFIIFCVLNYWLCIIFRNFFFFIQNIIYSCMLNFTITKFSLKKKYISSSLIDFKNSNMYFKKTNCNFTFNYIYIFYFIIILVMFLYFQKLNIIFDYKIFTENLLWESYLYKFSELWNNHQGSLFLWILILLFYKFVLHSNYNFSWYNSIFITLSFFIEFFIIIFFTYNSNLFLKIEFYTNFINNIIPVLKDFLLIIHPPFLYLGYLSVSIIFNFSIFYIIFVRAINLYMYIKKYIIISWVLLSFGIFLGSWWAYQELGWGGWWYWDPIENISIIPWFFLIFLFHYLFIDKFILQIKYKKLLLVLFFIYFLNLFGTFIVRMGLLNSVHSFVNNNIYIYFFFCGVIQNILFIFFLLYLKKNKLNNFFFKINMHFILKIVCFVFLFIVLSIIILTYLPLFFKKISIINYTFFNKIFEPWVFVLILLYIFFLISKNRLINIFSLLTYVYFFLMILIIFYTNLINCIIFFSIFLFIIYIYINFNFLKKIFIWENNFIVSFIIHNFYIALIFMVIISKNYELNSVFIMNLNDICIFFNYIFELTNIFFINFSETDINFFQYDISNFLKVFNKIYTEKRFYIESNTFLNKNNTFSNLLYDVSIYPGIGNLKDGWIFKINILPFVSFIWLFAIFSFIIIIIFYKRNIKKLFSYDLLKNYYLIF